MRVVIAEDSVLLRAGLTRIIADAGEEVVATVGSADELMTAAERHQPDLAIVDVRMPPTHTDDGLRAAIAIRARWPQIGILVLSQYVEERYATELLAGETTSIGYLLKDRIADVNEFLAAVRRVGDGGTALDPEVVAQLLARSRRRDPLERLTPREREVLALMAEGRTNPAIARQSRGERQGGREARQQHLRQARPAASRRRPPPGPGGAPVREELAMSGFGWRAVGGVLALGTVAWAGFNTVTLLAHDERTEVTTYDAASVRSIDVDNSAGSVTILGSPERSEITVTARISEGLRATGERQELIGDQLELQSSCPLLGGDWCRVNYTVELPAGVDVRVDADNGRIRAQELDGVVDLDTDNGGVEVVDVTGDLTIAGDNGSIRGTELASGTVVAETDNGSVTLEFVEPPNAVDARSDNGSVEVVIPNTEVAYRVDATTDNGDVSDNIRTAPDSARTILVETDNGDATVRYGR